jgi:hypothetical protein
LTILLLLVVALVAAQRVVAVVLVGLEPERGFLYLLELLIQLPLVVVV